MPAPDAIPGDRLAKRIGPPKAPALLDARRPALRSHALRRIATTRARPKAVLTPGMPARPAPTLAGHGRNLAADMQGRSLRVTRAQFKGDRLACSVRIHRLVGPAVVFRFVAPAEVLAVAEMTGAPPFDVMGVPFSQRTDTCTFNTLLSVFGLRGANTRRLDLAPGCAGLLAASLGLSWMYSDDQAQMQAEGTHVWPAAAKRAR